MRKKKKRIVALSFFTLLLTLYLVNHIWQRLENASKDNVEDLNTPAFSIHPDSVTKFKINNTSFVKLSGSWFIEEVENIPADDTKITYFLSFLYSIKKIRIFDPDPSVDYGFKRTSITLNNKMYRIGGYGFRPDTINIQHPSGKVIVISSKLKDHIKVKIVSWFNKEIGLAFKDIAKISVMGETTKHLFYKLERFMNNWFFIGTKGKRFKASNDAVEKLILSLKNMRAEMILFDSLLKERKQTVTLTLRYDDDIVDKLYFFKSRPQGFIAESCFYNKNNTKLVYQIKCSAHDFLTQSRSHYLSKTDFSIPRRDTSRIEIRTKQYLMSITKHKADHWDYDGKNVLGPISSLFEIFDKLTISTICTKKCGVSSDQNTLIIVSFFDSNSDRIKKFSFNTMMTRSWFKVDDEKIFLFY